MDMKTKAIGLGANELAHVVLQFFAVEFSKVKKNREYLRTKDGWLNFSIGLTTEDGTVCPSGSKTATQRSNGPSKASTRS